MTSDLEVCRIAGLAMGESHALISRASAIGRDVRDVLKALCSSPRISDFGIIAPRDATVTEVSSLISETAKRSDALGRLLTRREKLIVLADVCGEVECPAIRSRVSVGVLEAVRS